ncbi:GAF domain-containing protein [Actinomadura sp. 7K507]|uniref:GAF domain-containing protein n=1 Tax=Actinomadura sp. 7K507 TaxID=2530365 RepID=UPI00104B3C2E|nr:GAF domain-containing protein [Actinomadura sp. 7K507]TDC91954.1 GAF domain-containing protein [Actinomadura sp. 7K507]
MPDDTPTGTTGADTELHQRIQLLTDLGLGEATDRFDAFAADLARSFAAQLGAGAETPYAMVNLVTHEQQFIGLHCPAGKPPVGRTMSREHGYCPEVVERRNALVLPDVYAHPRFAGNPVVDQIGIRTYAGAPLIDPLTGILLGTVCTVGTTGLPLDTGEPSRVLIKERAARFLKFIGRTITPSTRRHANRHSNRGTGDPTSHPTGHGTTATPAPG